jgi:hypothetical protein
MNMLNKNFSAPQMSATVCVARTLQDERGSTIPIYAIGLLLLASASAAALTVNRRTLTQSVLQGAADTASFTATNVYADLKTKQDINQLSDAAIEAKARAAAAAVYEVNSKGANITQGELDIQIKIDKDESGETTGVTSRVTPSGDLPLILGGFLGEILSTKVGAAAEAHRGIGTGTSVYTTSDKKKLRNLEVVLVLDVTGSMGGTIPGESDTKMAGLRRAVKSFVNGVYGSKVGLNEAPPANIKIGIIPYSNSVNVGKLLSATDLEVPADIAGWVANNNDNGWRGCIEERSTTPNLTALDPVGGVVVRPDALDVRDAPQNITPEKWTPYYNPPVEFFQQFQRNFTVITKNDSTTVEKTAGIRSTQNWFRPSDFNSSRAPLRLVRNSVSEYWREDTAAPAETEARDANADIVPRVASTTELTGTGSPNSGCVAPALSLAAGYTKKRLSDYVDGLTASGWTHSNLGMAWANRMLSPWAPLAGAKDYTDEKTDKLIVLMTDGYITAGDIYSNTNTTTSTNAGQLLTSSAVQSPAGFFRVDERSNYNGFQMSWAGYYYSYGLSAFNRLVGTQADGKPNSNASGHILAHQQRLLMACKVARTPHGYSENKAATKVYTILFGFSLPVGSRNIYEECATEPSYALTAENSAKLTEAFTRISDQSKLQLTE